MILDDYKSFDPFYISLEDSQNFLTLFHLGSGMTLSPGGVFLTRSSFEPYNSMKSHASTQNLFPDNFFDIQTSFDTTISTVKEVWLSISVCQSRSTYA